MFLAIHPPTAPESSTKAAPFGTAIHSNDNYFGTKINAIAFTEDENTSTFIVEDAITTDNIVTLTASPLANNITGVCVGDRNYALAKDKDNPVAGEFTFDYYSKAIAIYLIEGDSLEKDSLIYKAGIKNLAATRSTDICAAPEPLLVKWNATDNAVTRDRWNASPTFSFGFKSCVDQLTQINSELGAGTIHTAFNNRWVVDTPPAIEYRDLGQITVTVDLVHWLASYGNPSKSPLDKELFLKKKTGSNSYKRVRTIAEFAAEAGIVYRGAEIKIRVPRSTSVTETTTLRSLLQQYAVVARGFVEYTSDGIEVKPWRGGRTIVINEDRVISKSVVEDPQGNGNYLNGVPLHTEWRNRKINLDFAEESESEGVTIDWKFINCRDLEDLYSVREDKGFYFETPSVEILRNPSICFDVGGAFIKKAIRTTRQNGIPTFELKLKAGYAFTSAETHDTEITAAGNLNITLNQTQFPQSYWDVCSTTTHDWIFNQSNYWYLDRIEISGTEKARLRQESDRLEAVTRKAEAIRTGSAASPDPSLLAQSKAYEFTKNLPVNDLTVYKTAKHEDYFDDVIKRSQCEGEDYIESQFMLSMVRFRQDKLIGVNPENTDEVTYPPIEYGKYLNEVVTVKVTETGDNPKYEVHTSKQTNEGERFKNSRAESNIAYHDSTPPIHQRLDFRFDYENQDSTAIANRERYQNENYYLYSPGVIGEETKTNENGKGYPDVDDPNSVLAIALTELSIINTLNSLSVSINILPRNDLRKGDFALFRGKRWKILDINDVRTVNNKKQKSDRLSVKLGLYLEPGLRLENRNSCSL